MISSFVIPFSSDLQFFPASWYFLESVFHIRWPKYWSFSFTLSPSSEYSGLISFGLVWPFYSPRDSQDSSPTPQFKSIDPFTLSFFMVLLSHPYMTTGKNIALTRETFVSKVMSLLFKMLSRLVIAFLPRSKCLLISWLQSPSAVILQPKLIVSHCFHCILIYLLQSDWTRCHDVSFLNAEF